MGWKEWANLVGIWAGSGSFGKTEHGTGTVNSSSSGRQAGGFWNTGDRFGCTHAHTNPPHSQFKSKLLSPIPTFNPPPPNRTQHFDLHSNLDWDNHFHPPTYPAPPRPFPHSPTHSNHHNPPIPLAPSAPPLSIFSPTFPHIRLPNGPYPLRSPTPNNPNSTTANNGDVPNIVS